MGAKYTAAQKKAADEYLKKFEKFTIRIAIGRKAEYKKLADAEGKSLNQFIIDCVEAKL